MKYLPLLFLLVACHETPVAKYPKVVHNVCAGLWAVQTDSIPEEIYRYAYVADPHPTIVPVFFGLRSRWALTMPIDESDRDTVLNSDLGHEFQFRDSISAIDAYTSYMRKFVVACRYIDSVKKVERDKAIAAQRIKDCLFQCQHNYQ